MPGRRWIVAGSLLAIAACSTSPRVAVERSDRSAGQVTRDTEVGLPDIGAERPPTGDADGGDLPVVEAPPTSLSWGDCSAFDIPPPDVLGTAGWECATLDARMDPFGDAEAGSVELALTRHPATGDRRGAILVNPGGPGGDGLSTAWALRDELSSTLLRGFDLLSWDPRGIGQSRPKIECDDDVPADDANFIARCVDLTGPLSAYLAAPYTVADMEAIRVALGEDELNFLGYSYGSLLGANYAAAHPGRVGAFVLDGVTDPRVGTSDGPSDGGFPSLADDGFEAARDRFSELCDATDRCLFSLDAGTVLDDLAVQVSALPTPDFDRPPERVDTQGYLDVIDNALTYAGDWELLATALADADGGDASALASLAAGPEDIDNEQPGESDFSAANFMIYCADLGPLLTNQTFCDAMPANAERLSPVLPVDLERDVLVIGTEFDPLTPGYHAVDFAAALGDATHVIWEGVGHTAFPGWTPCIDDAVDAQFLRAPVPADGTRCSFLFGIDDDELLGDELFGHGDIESDRLLRSRLELETDPAEAACLARHLNQEPDEVISHVILEVTSDAAREALAQAAARC
jgi:pimeloyl-ACP methyl ester carboxylesterase